jgi:hypothetical protein
MPYVTNDLTFELDEAYTDLTIHELDAPLPGPDRRVLSVLVEREPLPAAKDFADAVREHVRADGRQLPLHDVREVRELSVSGAPAMAVVFTWAYAGVRHWGRQIHVLAGTSHLVLSATAPEAHRAACDQYFDRLIETLKLAP